MSNHDLIYVWTNELFPPSEQQLLPLRELNNMVSRIWAVRFPDEEAPRVKGARNELRAETNGDVIHMPLSARYVAILLHEIAHVIELRAGRTGYHGPEYLNTLIDLYEAYTPVTRDVLLAQAIVLGIINS